MAPASLELWELGARKKGSKEARATAEGKARNKIEVAAFGPEDL